MRSSLFSCAIALSILLPATSAAQTGGQSFAYVNTQLILQAAPGAAEAQAEFQKDVDALRGQIQQLSDSLSVLDEAFSREAAALSPTAREARQKSLIETRDSFEQRVDQLNQQAEQRQFELMQPIMDNVRKALDDLRIEAGYSFIFDIANSSFIVAADKNLDVTEKVITKLRAMPKPTAAPSAPAAAGPTARPAGVQTRPATRTP